MYNICKKKIEHIEKDRNDGHNRLTNVTRRTV